jgi:hypothetical protein
MWMARRERRLFPLERDDVVLSPHLQVRHGLSKELLQHMAAVESLAAAVAE